MLTCELIRFLLFAFALLLILFINSVGLVPSGYPVTTSAVFLYSAAVGHCKLSSSIQVSCAR